MYRIKNQPSGAKNRSGKWTADGGIRMDAVQVSTDTSAEADALSKVMETSRERLISLAERAGVEIQLDPEPTWHRVALRKVAAEGMAPFWVATFMPGVSPGTSELGL